MTNHDDTHSNNPNDVGRSGDGVMSDSPLINRRRALHLGAATIGGVVLAACSSDSNSNSNSVGDSGSSSESAGGQSATSAPDSDLSIRPDCVLTPEEIEGPFYTDLNLVRRDITDDRTGSALTLKLTVVDADTCQPIPDATVDIWHADAGGLYSAFTGQGDDADIDTTAQSFLRGVQPTDETGLATFATIYPGWYQGRTTHIHIKVHFNDATRVTSQLYFPDDVTASVYGDAAYRERGQKDTSNDDDDFSADDQSLLMTVTEGDGGHIATHILGIKRT